MSDTTNSSNKGQTQKGMAKARGKSRRLAMQAVYQWQMTGQSAAEILAQLAEDRADGQVDDAEIAGFCSLLGAAGSETVTKAVILMTSPSAVNTSLQSVISTAIRIFSFNSRPLGK